MRRCGTKPSNLFIVLLVLSPVLAQESGYDPRDLSGVWYAGTDYQGDATEPGATIAFGPDMPLVTSEGLQRYRQNIPTVTTDSRVPAVDDPALSNDPSFTCNPR